jgi:hypothetical protein
MDDEKEDVLEGDEDAALDDDLAGIDEEDEEDLGVDLGDMDDEDSY